MWPVDGYRGGWNGTWLRPDRWFQNLTRPLKAPHAVSRCTVPPAVEPLSLADAKLRAGMTYTSPDERDALLLGFVAAARAKVELDTGYALLEQTRVVWLDVLYGNVLELPWQSVPLQSVESVVTTDVNGLATTLDPATYLVDLASARIALAPGQAWPTQLNYFQPWEITIVAGWPDVASLTAAAPLLVQAVGLLTAHLATAGRDLMATGTVMEVPHGYRELLNPMVDVTVA